MRSQVRTAPQLLVGVALLTAFGCTSKSRYEGTSGTSSAGGSSAGGSSSNGGGTGGTSGAGGTEMTGVAGVGGTFGGSAGTGGGVGLAGSAGADNEAECDPGALDCSGSTPIACSEDGQWVISGATCALACLSGACSECVEGTRQCQDGVARVCVLGAWTTDEVCEVTCEAGECVDGCVEERLQCSGDVSLQICQGGAYVDHEECEFLCLGDACTGECRPDASRCNPEADNEAQRCNATGNWDVSTACDSGTFCVSGSCKPCEPGDRRCGALGPEECSDAGEWTEADACSTGMACDPDTGICGTAVCVFDENVFGDGSVFAP